MTRPTAATGFGPLFDLDYAEASAAADMNLALKHAEQDWTGRAWSAILTLALAGRPFIADDVRRLVGDPPDGTSPNAMGALINRARAHGLISQVGFGKSARIVGHGNLVRIWKGVA